ncbi:response regulator transcription factor [Salsuginibacillus kocurii]|uniref:response regulator transcription factor n=1 Tax=Salsuginibacillus kocurii TaxID=427078 RepID=UPI0003704238|nr:LuxR C-terminal-related transcriptional regulator [Salsuginibacillus kocurii]
MKTRMKAPTNRENLNRPMILLQWSHPNEEKTLKETTYQSRLQIFPLQSFRERSEASPYDIFIASETESEEIVNDEMTYEQLKKEARIGALIDPDNSSKLDELLEKECSCFVAAEREPYDKLSRLEEAIHFSDYVDPVLQHHLLAIFQPLKEEYRGQGNIQLNFDKAMHLLTETEAMILDEILKGKSNGQIAKDCYLALSTVNNHVSHLTRKIGANDRTHAVKRAIELNIIKE